MKGIIVNDFSEGDLIEASRVEVASSTTMRGIVKSNETFGLTLGAQGYEPAIEWLEGHGFTLTLLEKATPVLPTEWGYYSDNEGDIWRLNTSGDWVCIESPHIDDNPSAFVPFIRLEPVAETAKKVLDRVLEEYRNEHPLRFVSDILPLVAKEFGVAS